MDEVEIDGNTVRLTSGQLDRQTYLDTDKVLRGLGGKWNRKARGHVFNFNPSEKIELALVTGGYVDEKKVLGFFETPPDLATQLVEMAEIQPGMLVLEPSAGLGAIAEAAARIVGRDMVWTVEIDPERAEVLRTKGFPVWEGDFLAWPGGAYDRVVMNPPFPRQTDIDHVFFAWEDCLEPGGRLVSVMSAGVTFRNNRKTAAFRELVETHGRIEPNTEGAFKASGTMVNTVTVVMDKPWPGGGKAES